MIPENLKYTKSHEWVKVSGNKAKFGITAHAVQEIRDIIFIELNPQGQEVVQGKPFGNVESVKAVFEVNAPVSGKIVSVNEKLLDNPETVSKSAYEDGWMVEVEIKNPGELNNLMDAKGYEAFLKTEGAGH